jgi:Gpi18-like mannosyltransferase
MVALALLSAMALPFLLPKMHERYLFLGDVLALALALAVRDRRTVVIAVAVQLTSLAALVSYIYAWPAPALVGSIVGGIALISIWQLARESGACWPNLRRSASPIPS